MIATSKTQEDLEGYHLQLFTDSDPKMSLGYIQVDYKTGEWLAIPPLGTTVFRCKRIAMAFEKLIDHHKQFLKNKKEHDERSV